MPDAPADARAAGGLRLDTAPGEGDTPTVARFAALLAERLGLYFPPERYADLRRAMAAVAKEMGQPGPLPCMVQLLNETLDRERTALLARHLTVGETYFFREPAVFAALEQTVLPALIAERRQAGSLSLRLWSAGCCSGEELYSLAILLQRLLPDYASWQLTLLGSDVNPVFLQRAESGVYSGWSFRNAPPWLLPGYFDGTVPGKYVLRPAVRRMARFAYLNLVEDSYPSLDSRVGGMDLILCRNVLMYFGATTARDVVQRLYRSLVPGGWLVVGAAETSQSRFADFVPVSFPDATLYRKGPLPPGALVEPPRFIPLPEPVAWVTHEALPPVAAPPDEPSLRPPPRPLPTPLEQAEAYFHAGAYEQVIAVLDGEALLVTATLLMARALANLGRLDEARACCERAIAQDKLNPGAHYLLAVILDEQGADDAVERALKRALYLDPRFVLAYFALGGLARRRGRPQEAVRCFDHVLDLLGGVAPDTVLPESDGLTAGRLAEMVNAGRQAAARSAR